MVQKVGNHRRCNRYSSEPRLKENKTSYDMKQK